MLTKATILAKHHNSNGKQKIYAIITDKRDRVLAHAGNNYIKSHPTQRRLAESVDLEECIYIHAEIAALIKVKKPIPKNSKIYISRIDSNGVPVLSAPCPICQHALMLAGITSIYHT